MPETWRPKERLHTSSSNWLTAISSTVTNSALSKKHYLQKDVGMLAIEERNGGYKEKSGHYRPLFI